MIDIDQIEESVLAPFKERMQSTQQSAHWHGEGNVLVHTQMVCEALTTLPEYAMLDETRQHVLKLAALLHDIGKVTTTTLKGGEWRAPHHAPTGSRIARELLWKSYGWCGDQLLMQLREAVCLLIRYHSYPPHAIDMKNCALRLHRIAADSLLTPYFSVKMLCMLAKADMLVRRCNDQPQMLDQIALCEEMAREEGCYENCYAFPTDATRRACLSGKDVWKEQEVYDDTWGEVVMPSGLPGTGKDTWIARHLPDLPMISLDNILRERKISPKEARNIAREQAKEYLRRHQPFVWNATNINTQLREALISLFETYRARVRIVYLETDWHTQQERNRSREAIVPTAVLEQMLGKLTPPEAFEARKVEWISI